MVIENTLKVLFAKSCRSQVEGGRNATFDRLSIKTNNMTMGTFNMFCKKYGILRQKRGMDEYAIPRPLK